MKIWKVILATLVIFGAGIVVGGLLGPRIGPAGAPVARAANPQNLNPGQFRLEQLHRRLNRELGLTKEQDDRIKKIIAASMERTKDLYKPVTLQLSHETQNVCDEIRAELTPEQQARFDTFSKERPERGDHGGERGERGNHHRPPGSPTNSLSFRTNDQM